MASILVTLPLLAGTDGEWKSASSGGSWSDAANWVDGVKPDGGTALFNLTSLTTTDLRVTTAGLGDGTITVPTGRRVIFSTTSEQDGVFTDAATQTRVYANTVILQG